MAPAEATAGALAPACTKRGSGGTSEHRCVASGDCLAAAPSDRTSIISDDAACAQTPEGQLVCCPELRVDDRLQALQQLKAMEGHYLAQRGVRPASQLFFKTGSKQESLLRQSWSATNAS